MIVGAPLVEAEQHSPIGVEDLPEVVVGGKGGGLAEQRLIPCDRANFRTADSFIR